jgi:hypothetical protein
MAIKTFTDNTTLPASDINTYLTNSGLVLVKSQTITGSVASVTVTNAFDSTYDNYYITLTGGTAVSAAAYGLQLGPSSVSGYNTGYYAGISRVTAAAAQAPLGSNNNSRWEYLTVGDATGLTIAAKIYQPFLALKTMYFTEFTDPRPAESWGSGAGMHNTASSFTDFSIFGGTNIVGGTITVYGFRKG